ncbi:putative SET domain containing protein [Leishmania naiffi]|uniref:SET domain containing protein n=1 Tax=Leishmania naiffi TaxID=5678 RepID=A0AAW3CCW6_9TRYP
MSCHVHPTQVSIGAAPRMAVQEMHPDAKRKGRRVVATMDLKPGNAIFAAPPDIAVLYSPFASHICARCLVADVRACAEPHKAHHHHPHQQQRVTLSRSPIGAPSSLSSSSSSTHATAASPVRSYCCPNCDQFVLCAPCVVQLLLDIGVDVMSSTGTDAINTTATVLQRRGEGKRGISVVHERLTLHPLLCAHAISCAWYTSLPASIRAPGNDTDFLRFCLDYGARAHLGDTAMMRALATLDTNASVQSRESMQLCEVFARDRVVATFGKDPKVTPTALATAGSAKHMGGDSLSHQADAHASMNSIHRGADSDGPRYRGSSTGDLFPPRYPIAWTDLRDILLRTRCNSIGFPYNTEETTGWSLHETVCMLNHSCVPNAAVVMLYDSADAMAAAAALAARTGAPHSALPEGRSEEAARRKASERIAAFRAVATSSESPHSTSYSPSLAGWIGIEATRPIAAGEEITISYVDLGSFGDDLQTRSRHLLAQYRFLCTCDLCIRQRSQKQ